MSLTQSLVITLLLIALNAFFSAAEIALAASRRLRLRQLVAAGDKRAEKVIQVQAQPGDYFTVVQIAQNAVAILGGIVGEGAFSPALTSWLAAWLYCRNTIYPPRGSLYGNWFPTAAARGCRCGGDSPRKTTSGSTWQ